MLYTGSERRLANIPISMTRQIRENPFGKPVENTPGGVFLEIPRRFLWLGSRSQDDHRLAEEKVRSLELKMREQLGSIGPNHQNLSVLESLASELAELRTTVRGLSSDVTRVINDGPEYLNLIIWARRQLGIRQTDTLDFIRGRDGVYYATVPYESAATVRPISVDGTPQLLFHQPVSSSLIVQITNIKAIGTLERLDRELPSKPPAGQ